MVASITAENERLQLVERKNPLLAFKLLQCRKEGKVGLDKEAVSFDSSAKQWIIFAPEGKEWIDLALTHLEGSSENHCAFIYAEAKDVYNHLSQSAFDKLLSLPNFSLFSLEELHDEHLLDLAWKNAGKSFVFHCAGQGDDHLLCESLRGKVEFFFFGVELAIAEYADMKLGIAKNLYASLLRSQEIKHVFSFKDAFKGMPAVVCGAGASLESHYEELRLMQDKALIFSGGSSASLLAKEGIRSSFQCFCDPESYERVKFALDEKAAKVFTYRVDSRCMDFFLGKSIFFPQSGDFPLEKYFLQEHLHSYDEFETGWNVGSVMTKLALYMGCSQVIFIGMDMKYGSSSDHYAKGIKSEFLSKDQTGLEYQSGSEKTKKDFFLGRAFIDELTLRKGDAKFFQVGPGSLGEKVIKLDSLQAIMKSFQQNDIEGILHSKITKSPSYSLRNKKSKAQMKDLLRSLLSCIEILKNTLEHIDLDKKKGKDFVEERYALDDLDLEEELSYRTLLYPLWKVWHRLVIKDTMSAFEKKIATISFFLKASTEHTELLEGYLKEKTETR